MHCDMEPFPLEGVSPQRFREDAKDVPVMLHADRAIGITEEVGEVS